ncbi:nitrate reductase molybdenum cofactor assembly chaperone [Aquipuribacter nitratireducens]|uniref:Nitrate reductase molybdenum cofactor assembly chaperone n=1 Tax=Aquipuribacter nitratireducens TaxID=650104 RepID=A0ABW0GR63_9MICO
MSAADRRTALVYQVASRLLGYPDEQLLAQLPLLRDAVDQLPQPARTQLGSLLEHLAGSEPTALGAEYVGTFDLRRRCCPYLTYYAYGDTRKRGVALLAFTHAYKAAGLVMHPDELPDHLCVVLEFAATADLDVGRRLLLDHRAGLELMRLSLADAASPWAGALAAVTGTLPPLRGDEREAVRRLAAEGPPEEEVGLEPFAPPDYMGARR